MRFEPPLSNLFSRCMTLCVAECCGIDAFDFSPIHVASYLLMYTGAPNPGDVEQIRAQLESLTTNYGSDGLCGRGATLDDLNQVFSGAEIDSLAAQLRSALEAALILIDELEQRSSPPTLPRE